jgi:hypothetical protein
VGEWIAIRWVLTVNGAEGREIAVEHSAIGRIGGCALEERGAWNEVAQGYAVARTVFVARTSGSDTERALGI